MLVAIENESNVHRSSQPQEKRKIRLKKRGNMENDGSAFPCFLKPGNEHMCW